jgi:hypothetical protein
LLEQADAGAASVTQVQRDVGQRLQHGTIRRGERLRQLVHRAAFCGKVWRAMRTVLKNRCD